MTATTPEVRAGSATRRLLEDQISDERERRTSLESRGASVIASGGVVVALIVGVAAAFTDPSNVVVPGGALVALGCALAALVGAAFFSIWVVLPTKYQGVDLDAFVRLVEERWWEAAYGPTDRRTAEAQVVMLASLREANRSKAIKLSIALGLEATAVLLLGAAAAVVLGGR